MNLELKNPHSVLAAIERRPQDVLEIRIGGGPPSDAWRRVVEAAAPHGIPVQSGIVRAKPTHGRDKGERQSVAEAVVKERRGVSLEELLSPAGGGGLWLALDCLQDPHNVGAVFRTAAFFGVKGMVISRDRSAPLSGTVYDVAAGGCEHVPFAQPSNLAQALEIAKKQGLWVLGTSEHATKDVRTVPRDRPWLLVVGNEEQGLRRLTLDRCDETCCIPSQGGVTSLNVSVATGILIASLT